MSYANITNPANFQLQDFAQFGFRVITTDFIPVPGEQYRTLYVLQDAVVTATTQKGDDITSKAILAGTLLHGLFNSVSITSGRVLAYAAGRVTADEIIALYEAYVVALGGTLENTQCAIDTLNDTGVDFFADASLVMIPEGYATGVVYGQRPLTSDSQLTFTRASTATRVGPDGAIEKVRTNLVLQSNSFDTTWNLSSNMTLTSGQSGYDGSSDAWECELTISASFKSVSQSVSHSGVNTFSVYAKAGTISKMSLRSLSGTDAFVIFNLSSGTIEAIGSNAITGTMTDAGGGWYRCTVTYSASQSNVYIYMNDMSTPAIGTIYIQDAQLEAGDIVTDYIPTTTAAVSVGPVANLPRIDYTGGGCGKLLLEPQRTNEMPYSEYLLGWTIFTNIAITQNQTTSPQGITNGVLMARSGSGDLSGGVRYTGISITANSKCYSVFAKANAHNFIQLYHSGDAQGYVNFDISTGAVGTSGSKATGTIESYGSGWYRCTAIYDSTNAFGSSYYIGFAASASAPYAGGAVPDTSSVYLYGVQLESSASYPSSYIPTSGAAVTRLADACSKTGISSLIGQTQGTLFLEISALDLDSSIWRTIGVSDGTTNNMINFYFTGRGIANEVRALVRAGAVNYFSEFYVGATITNTIKVAIAYASNDAAFYVNGVQVATGSSVTVPACSDFLTKEGSGAAPMLGNLSQVLLFPTRLSNEQLQTLTSL